MNKTKQKSILNVKSGAIALSKCIAPDKAYEVVNPELQTSIRRLLDQTGGFLVIQYPTPACNYGKLSM